MSSMAIVPIDLVQARKEVKKFRTEFEERLGYEFETEENLIKALIRPDLACKRCFEHDGSWPTLGDALWRAGVLDHFFDQYNDSGDLTIQGDKYNAGIEQVGLAIKMGLQDYIITSKGESNKLEEFIIYCENMGWNNLDDNEKKCEILSGTFEALICGIYLDRGFEALKAPIRHLLNEYGLEPDNGN